MVCVERVTVPIVSPSTQTSYVRSSSHTGLWLGVVGIVAGFLLAVGVFLVADGLFEILEAFGVSFPRWLVPYITGIFVLFPALGLSGVLIARKRPVPGAYLLITAGVLETIASFPIGLISGGFLVAGGVALLWSQPRR